MSSVSLRVIVVDDTIVYRMIMKSVAEMIPGVEVVASASNGLTALDKIARDRPDVVLLDVEMPVMDGLTALQRITREYPDVTVIMVSGVSRSNASIVMECLGAGAMDFVTKPLEQNPDKARDALRIDLEPIFSVVRQKKQRALEGGATPAAPVTRMVPRRSEAVPTRVVPQAQVSPPVRSPAVVCPRLVLIGSSTGGPAALTSLMASIVRPLPVPVLIVQHMPPLFTTSLAHQLDRVSCMDVREAEDGMGIRPGLVVLAAGGRHMVVRPAGERLEIGLHDGPKVNECRPAVDVLFASVAALDNMPVLAVVLTGMGRDGANGVGGLRQSGATYCITQSRDSCVVYGMPRSVEELGLSDESLPIEQIGPRIMEICG
jgi:two-component system chemotaxis response regulator CheB